MTRSVSLLFVRGIGVSECKSTLLSVIHLDYLWLTRVRQVLYSSHSTPCDPFRRHPFLKSFPERLLPYKLYLLLLHGRYVSRRPSVFYTRLGAVRVFQTLPFLLPNKLPVLFPVSKPLFHSFLPESSSVGRDCQIQTHCDWRSKSVDSRLVVHTWVSDVTLSDTGPRSLPPGSVVVEYVESPE